MIIGVVCYSIIHGLPVQGGMCARGSAAAAGGCRSAGIRKGVKPGAYRARWPLSTERSSSR